MFKDGKTKTFQSLLDFKFQKINTEAARRCLGRIEISAPPFRKGQCKDFFLRTSADYFSRACLSQLFAALTRRWLRLTASNCHLCLFSPTFQALSRPPSLKAMTGDFFRSRGATTASLESRRGQGQLCSRTRRLDGSPVLITRAAAWPRGLQGLELNMVPLRGGFVGRGPT